MIKQMILLLIPEKINLISNVLKLCTLVVHYWRNKIEGKYRNLNFITEIAFNKHQIKAHIVLDHLKSFIL